MLDTALLRKDLPGVAQRLRSRGFELDVAALERLEADRKSVQTRTEELQARRNALSKQVGQARSRGEDASALMAQVAEIPDELKQLEQHLGDVQARLQQILMEVPNLAHESVPVGHSSEHNVEVRRWGTAPRFDFAIKVHVDLGAPLGMDFEAAARLSGARFVVLKGALARLHRALAQFMLDVQTSEHGYTECYTPYIVNAATLTGTGQLPKFEQDLFWVYRGRDAADGDEERSEERRVGKECRSRWSPY